MSVHTFYLYKVGLHTDGILYDHGETAHIAICLLQVRHRVQPSKFSDLGINMTMHTSLHSATTTTSTQVHLPGVSPLLPVLFWHVEALLTPWPKTHQRSSRSPVNVFSYRLQNPKDSHPFHWVSAAAASAATEQACASNGHRPDKHPEHKASSYNRKQYRSMLVQENTTNQLLQLFPAEFLLGSCSICTTPKKASASSCFSYCLGSC